MPDADGTPIDPSSLGNADEVTSLFPGMENILSADWTTGGTSALAADPEHGGVTEESLDAYLRARFSQPGGAPVIAPPATSGGGVVPSSTAVPPSEAPLIEQPPPGTEPGGPLVEPAPGGGDQPAPGAPPVPSTEPPVVPPTEPEPTLPDQVTVDGRVYTRDQLLAWARFQSALDPSSRDFDPAFRQLVADFYTGRTSAGAPLAQPPAAPPALGDLRFPAPPAAPDVPAAPPAAPFDDSFLDPAVVALRAQVARLEQSLAARSEADAATQAQLAAVAQATQARSIADSRAVIEGAAEQFGQQYGLSAEELKRLRTTASNMKLMEPWLTGIDPVTGAPLTPNLTAATHHALETAMYADPTIRERQVRAAMVAEQERARHRQKLAGVGGTSSATAPPPPPRPGSPEAHGAMVDEVAAMLSGNWTEPGRG